MRLNAYNKEDIELNRNAMYNKGINDLVEKIELNYLGVHPDELYEKYYPREICNQVKELAEQLKKDTEPICIDTYNKAINDCLEIVKFHRDSWDGIEWAIRDIEGLKVENENKRSENN